MSLALKHPDSNLLFAHDICLIAERNDDRQYTMDKVYTAGNRFGLEVRSVEQRLKYNALDERNRK